MKASTRALFLSAILALLAGWLGLRSQNEELEAKLAATAAAPHGEVSR